MKKKKKNKNKKHLITHQKERRSKKITSEVLKVKSRVKVLIVKEEFYNYFITTNQYLS
jgi:hypothetical protein